MLVATCQGATCRKVAVSSRYHWSGPAATPYGKPVICGPTLNSERSSDSHGVST